MEENRFQIVFEKLEEARNEQEATAIFTYSVSVQEEMKEISELRRLVDEATSPQMEFYTRS